MLVYLLISGILKWDGKLATSAPSKSSQLIAPSETLICLILCSSLSIRACAAFKVWMGATTGSRVASVWLWCRVWNRLTEWRRWWLRRVILCAILRRGLLPIYPLVEADYSLLNWSHDCDKLVNSDDLGVHISLIYSLVWLILYSCQPASNSSPRRRIQTRHQNYSYKHRNIGWDVVQG